MRKASNQSQSAMSQTFTGKLLDAAVKKQLKTEQENKELREKMHVMEIKKERT